MFLPTTFYLVNQPGIPLISVRRLFVFFWILAFLLLVSEHRFSGLRFQEKREGYPLRNTALFFSLMLGVVAVFTVGMNPPSVAVYFSIIFETLLPTVMIWSAFKDKGNLLDAIRLMMNIYFLIAIYGVVSFFVGYNPLLEILSDNSARNLVLTYEDFERGGVVGRAQAFFNHALQFGHFSAAFLVVLVGMQSVAKIFSPKKFFVMMAVFALAILATQSRSPIVFVFSAGFIYLAQMNVKSKFKYMALLLVALGILHASGLLENMMGEKLKIISSIFDELSGNESDLGGSNINMRQMQLEVAMKFFDESPIYGHGLAYIRELIESDASGDLLGAESFLFRLLVDMGSLGIAAYSILYTGIYSCFKKFRDGKYSIESRNLAALGIALLVGHLSFIFATGEMDTTYVFLILEMLLLKLIYLSQANSSCVGLSRRSQDLETKRI